MYSQKKNTKQNKNNKKFHFVFNEIDLALRNNREIINLNIKLICFIILLFFPFNYSICIN